MFREVNVIRARKPGFELGRRISKASAESAVLWDPGCSLGLPAPRSQGSQRPTISITTSSPETQLQEMTWAPASRAAQSPAVRERGAGAQGSPEGWGGRFWGRGLERPPGEALWVGPESSLDFLLSPSRPERPTAPKEGPQVPLPPACWVISGSPLP